MSGLDPGYQYVPATSGQRIHAFWMQPARPYVWPGRSGHHRQSRRRADLTMTCRDIVQPCGLGHDRLPWVG